jgi:hypothetical protein
MALPIIPVVDTTDSSVDINVTKDQITKALRSNAETVLIERVTKQFGNLRHHDLDETRKCSTGVSALKLGWEKFRTKKITQWSVKGIAALSWGLVFLTTYLSDPYTVNTAANNKISSSLMHLRESSMILGAISTILMNFFKNSQKHLENELQFLRAFLLYDLEKKKLMEVHSDSMEKSHLQEQVKNFLDAYDHLPEHIKKGLPDRDLWISYLLNNLPTNHPVKQKMVAMKTSFEQEIATPPKRIVPRQIRNSISQADAASPPMEEISLDDEGAETDIKTEIDCTDFLDATGEFCGRPWKKIEFDGVRFGVSGRRVSILDTNINAEKENDIHIDIAGLAKNSLNIPLSPQLAFEKIGI